MFSTALCILVVMSNSLAMSFSKDHFYIAKFNKILVFSTSQNADNSVSNVYPKNDCKVYWVQYMKYIDILV